MHIMRLLETRSKLVILLLALDLMGLLGIVDYLTGFELSFAVFYLIPVALAAWFADKTASIATAIMSALTWQLSNYLAGERVSHVLIGGWNVGTRLSFFLIVAFLIVRLKAALVHEREVARTDYLTGAANPRAFYEITNLEIARARRYGHAFSIMYMDADNFKAVNDHFGHHIGSHLLSQVVATIKANVRVTDTVARLGGDEFAILLPETGAAEARFIVERMQATLQVAMQARDWPVTFSIGMLTCLEAPAQVDDLIKRTDNLMYQVKRSGKNAIRHEILEPQRVAGAVVVSMS